jgi:hypothetical protein
VARPERSWLSGSTGVEALLIVLHKCFLSGIPVPTHFGYTAPQAQAWRRIGTRVSQTALPDRLTEWRQFCEAAFRAFELDIGRDYTKLSF